MALSWAPTVPAEISTRVKPGATLILRQVARYPSRGIFRSSRATKRVPRGHRCDGELNRRNAKRRYSTIPSCLPLYVNYETNSRLLEIYPNRNQVGTLLSIVSLSRLLISRKTACCCIYERREDINVDEDHRLVRSSKNWRR